jgi:hypothetical protein
VRPVINPLFVQQHHLNRPCIIAQAMLGRFYCWLLFMLA